MKRYVKNIRQFLKKLWRVETLIIIVAGIALVAAFIVVSKIPSGAAETELVTANSSSSIKKILENPVNAPYKLAALVSTTLSPSVTMIRAVSFVFYVSACIALYYALKHWHTSHAAGLTTLAFSTNSVVLSVGRLGAPLITVFGWFIFAVLLLWQIHSKSNKTVPIIALLGLGALLYTPGVLWFLCIIGFIYIKKFKKLFKNVKMNAILFGSFLGLLLVSPLIISFIRDPNSLKEWLLLPSTLNWGDVPRSVLRVPSAFIYRMPAEPLITVGRLPIFDLASGILFLIGLNAYRRKLKLDRTRVMVSSAIVGVIVGALGQEVLATIMLMPFAFSIIAAGIEFLLDEWNAVFPKNPFAKSFGLLMVTIVVIFGAYYQLTRFFVVWPQTPETREVYKFSRIIE